VLDEIIISYAAQNSVREHAIKEKFQLRDTTPFSTGYCISISIKDIVASCLFLIYGRYSRAKRKFILCYFASWQLGIIISKRSCGVGYRGEDPVEVVCCFNFTFNRTQLCSWSVMWKSSLESKGNLRQRTHQLRLTSLHLIALLFPPRRAPSLSFHALCIEAFKCPRTQKISQLRI
jgi:hypothetical protein